MSYFKLDLLKILEELVTNEEAVIRKEALNTFSLMLEHVSKDDLVNIVIPAIITINPKKLFTSKLASLDLMVAVYPICQIKEQQILLNKIVGMIQEESLILRRNLARHMGTIAKYVKKDILLHGFIKQFKNLVIDDQDSV